MGHTRVLPNPPAAAARGSRLALGQGRQVGVGSSRLCWLLHQGLPQQELHLLLLLAALLQQQRLLLVVGRVRSSSSRRQQCQLVWLVQVWQHCQVRQVVMHPLLHLLHVLPSMPCLRQA
jgi:hypothetical protein